MAYSEKLEPVLRQLSFYAEVHLTATHCNTLQHTATMLRQLCFRAEVDLTATHCNTLQHSATMLRQFCFRAEVDLTVTPCSTLQCTVAHLQHTATLQKNVTHCGTLPRTATHYNTLQLCCGSSPSALLRCISLQHTAALCNYVAAALLPH